LFERQELFGRVGIGSFDCGRERRVGGVELAVDHARDECEREAARPQFPDAREPFEMLGAVPGDPAVALGRGQEPALLVEANRVDRDVGLAGEILDAPPGVRHECDSRSDRSQNQNRP
jgi:hypothetical protein